MQKQLDDIVRYQSIGIAANYSDEIQRILKHCHEFGLNSHDTQVMSAYQLFILGYLAGIKAERTRKKTGARSWSLKG